MKAFQQSDLLNSVNGLKAGITFASRNSLNSEGIIRGLNLGENTNAPQAEVDKNFEIFFRELGLKPDQLARAEQVHGGEVKIVSQPGYYLGVDGLVTRQKHLTLAIKVADCAAVLLADPTTQTIAAVHAGWRGAAANILPSALQKMQSLGCEMNDVSAYISPCISVQNFEVGEEVAAKFDDSFIDRTIGPKPHLNLKSFLTQQLLEAGISRDSIDVDSKCTIEDERFYSFRRERSQAGRMLAFITFES
ncbi:peptidoglycan editing factor PgeF [Rhodohalobacter sp. SW132]|uniref:peptidoglycan editing factor PgeF n=1 Tax=Rhodohalobacter sp. SW132 TaxID=2293433 RepID=UPI000E2549F7|nr:peptidoglycan editing factor PgeF [Rhodohalobacter sp. SW132]REL38208.1 peptidoglycan editing factor PgeF [Rhodohalobacter sp. SW132]